MASDGQPSGYGRGKPSRVEISKVSSRSPAEVLCVLLVDAPVRNRRPYSVNGRAKTRFEGMRQPEGVQFYTPYGGQSCRLSCEIVGSISQPVLVRSPGLCI